MANSPQIHIVLLRLVKGDSTAFHRWTDGDIQVIRIAVLLPSEELAKAITNASVTDIGILTLKDGTKVEDF
ncbi:hypothetical protein PILCRDRAFT_8621 [Piloderma croceum F 1598]|uniref:Uncharacterized protein n=1 Tax=Piloderma croceum (strain F 1598) TaxID=765440 RepID=A0A0C3FQW2_PILCF|nr:hypothetical protein PILCRDRAFT_8621 [Piloderma croceum F 1598]